jgi:hypothetical protein
MGKNQRKNLSYNTESIIYNNSNNAINSATLSVKQMLCTSNINEKSSILISSILDHIANELNKNSLENIKIEQIADIVTETTRSEIDQHEIDIDLNKIDRDELLLHIIETGIKNKKI